MRQISENRKYWRRHGVPVSTCGSPGVCNASMSGAATLGDCVAAAFTKCIVNSSFRVRGRNCSIDVCWETKKFRVICLNPGSVMHMYARDLEDLRMLVTSTGEGCACPYLCGHSNGTRYRGTWFHQQ